MSSIKLNAIPIGIFWFLVCMLLGSCTIHVYHHYVNPPPTNGSVITNNNNPQPPSLDPDPNGNVEPVDLKEGVQFYLENESYNIKIYRNANGNEEFVGYLAGTRPLTVKAEIGDVIVFRFEDEKITTPPYTVKQLGVRELLKPKIRFVHSGYEAIIQDANYHSFDLLKVDPIHIDYKMEQNIDETEVGGGMRLQIFEDIRQGDIDYVDVRNSSGFRSNYVTKKGFDGAFTRKKWGSAKSTLVYGESNFQQSFSGNLSTSAGMDKVGKVKNSGSFSHNTTESSSYQFIYAFAKSTAELYTITVDPSIAKLSETFKKAVETELPRPTSLPASYEEMANHPLYPQYLAFIKKWGTHYASKVVYGGVEIAGMEIQEDTYSKATSFGFDVSNEVSANIKGVELERSVGFGYGQNESFKNITKDSKSFYFYKGGEGAVGSWDVDANTVQPIEADFNRLSELLTVSAMGKSMDASALEARREMLEFSISAYIGSETDYGRSLKERRYRISGAYMRVIEASEGSWSEVYGIVEISAGTTVPQNQVA